MANDIATSGESVQHLARVIGKSGNIWILDPIPSYSMLFFQLSVFKKKSLLDMHWDPSDYLWKHTNHSSHTKFIQCFQYFVKLGRKLLLSRKLHLPSAMKVWLANGASLLDASKYSKWLWSMQIRSGYGVCSRHYLLECINHKVYLARA